MHRRRSSVVTAVLALGVSGLVALAVPAGAATTADPTTTTTAPGGSGATTTTTTTTTPRSTTTTTTVRASGHGSTGAVATAPVAGDPPTAGPPELGKRGVRLPSDSIVAAMEELGLVRLRLGVVTSRRAELDAAIASHEQAFTRLRVQRDHERALRTERAVAAYRGQSTGWQLAVIMTHKLENERAVYLVAAADAAARQKIRRLEERTAKLEHRLTDERGGRADADAELVDLLTRVQRLEEKLTSSAGALALVAAPGSVLSGPSPIASAADLAAVALQRVLFSGKPLPADQTWTATRHVLAGLLAREPGGAGDERVVAAQIERDWDATSPAVLRVVLFALRQVGKPYVYATAGPDTYDCSGLTKRAYAEVQLGLPHFSEAQLRIGTPVLPSALRPGDLLAYGPDGSAHITMYIGGGLVVAAKGVAYGVVVETVRIDPTDGLAGATRIVP